MVMLKTILIAGVAGVAVATAALPAAAGEYTLCGNKANVVLKTPGADADPTLKQYFGIWDNGKWSTGICNGLVVSEVNGNKATVTYYYGAGPGASATPGSFTKTDATMKGKYLSFKSEKGADVSYELAGGELKGWFGNTELSKKLQKAQ